MLVWTSKLTDSEKRSFVGVRWANAFGLFRNQAMKKMGQEEMRGQLFAIWTSAWLTTLGSFSWGTATVSTWMMGSCTDSIIQVTDVMLYIWSFFKFKVIPLLAISNYLKWNKLFIYLLKKKTYSVLISAFSRSIKWIYVSINNKM